MTTELTAQDDLEEAIRQYRSQMGRWGFAHDSVRKRKVSNTFYKIYGFLPIEAYFEAVEAAPEGKDNYAAFGMSAIRAVMEGI